MVLVRVPSTSANLGPGFDSIGIALNLYNEYRFSLSNTGIEFCGFEEAFSNENNIIFITMKKIFQKYKFKYKGIKLELIKQNIPITRGLGSSSSCIVAGIVGAMALMDRDIDKDEVLKIATEIEGHPDNVAPAIFGGLVVAIRNEEEVIYNLIKPKDGIKFVACIPDFTLATKEARAILPKEVTIDKAIYNIGRAALLISCFQNGNYNLLKFGTQDKLHQEYRSELICGYHRVYNKALALGAYGCYLSGAGPTIMAIVDNNNNKVFLDNMKKYFSEASLKWNIKELEVENDGVTIIKC